MTKEISISLLLKVLKSAWWKILIITVAVAIAAAAFTTFFIPKKYSSSIEFYVINTSVSNEYTTEALLDATTKLSKDYIEIIKSDKMMKAVVEYLKSGDGRNQYTDNRITPEYIRSMISASAVSDKSFFTVTVTSTDKDFAYDVASAIQVLAPGIVKSTAKFSDTSNLFYKDDNNEYKPIKDSEYDIQCISVNRECRLPSAPSSPNVVSNTMIATVAAAVISYALFFVIKLFDTVIHGEESAKALVDLPIIGKVPAWETNAKKAVDNNKAKEYKK